jgi:NAD(P)H dehydrogenase (quinone)
MIIITGANGQLGRAVVERLLLRVPADRIGVSVRDPDKARDLRDRGVRVRRGDFADPAGLAHSFEGASHVLIVSANVVGEAAVGLHPAAIDAAKAAGAQRIFYTSHMGASPASHFAPMLNHAATEAALRDSGVAWTSLRNGFYATSALMLLGTALRTGELAVPQDGPVSWTAHADLAEATARMLADADARVRTNVNANTGTDAGTGTRLGAGPVGPTAPLTGSEALDFAALADLASELTGRAVKHVVVTDEEYRAGLIEHGAPEPAADLLLGMFAASRRGEFARTDPALGELIGRPPTPFRDVLKASLSTAG